MDGRSDPKSRSWWGGWSALRKTGGSFTTRCAWSTYPPICPASLLVWIIDPGKRVTDAYTQPDKRKRVRADKPRSGGEVLPGYELVLQELLDEMESE